MPSTDMWGGCSRNFRGCMKGSTKISLAIGLVVFAVLAIMGYRYLERERTAERLVGTWEQEASAETLKASLENMNREGQLNQNLPEDVQVRIGDPEELPSGPDEEAALEGISMPIHTGESGIALSLRTTIRFEEDGHFIVSVGDRESKGRWVLSNAKGKRKTVVARVMQTPTFEQRLIIHLEFQGKDRMLVSDDAGISSTFNRL